MPRDPGRPSPSPRLRVGVVGTAHWAQEVHAAGAVAAEHADLVAVWGRSRDKATTFAHRYGVLAADSFEALLDQVDVVTFAVPPQVQPALAVLAARAGRHVLLDKPVATTRREAEEVRAAVRQGGGQAATFFTRRFVPEFEQRLRDASIESWSAARVTWLANSSAPDSPYRDSAWRADPLAALWDLTPHVLSQLIPVLGAVERVSATRTTHGVDLRTHHAGGAHADISVSLRATAYVDEFRLLRPDGSEFVLDFEGVDAVEPFARALDGLVQRAAGLEVECPASLELGAEITRVLAEAEESLRA